MKSNQTKTMAATYRLAAARFVLAGITALCIAGCEKELTREEIQRKQREDFIKADARLKELKAKAEAERRAREEMSTKTIGGAMVRRTLETASGTAKKDKEADDRVRRALDRDFGAPQPASKPAKPAPQSTSKDEEAVTNLIDFTDEDFK
jgi:hypothetical protein